MMPHLHLYDSLRKLYQDKIKLFMDTYLNRISPVFSNIEQEAEAKANEYYYELGRNFNPDYHDPGDFAEAASERGYEHYEELSLMQYNTRLMWIVTMYQYWEQQVRKFLYEEIDRTHDIGSYKKFCEKGIEDIKTWFQAFNLYIDQLPCWETINELRLVTNTIKHGPGKSEQQLRKIRPDLFVNPVIKIDLLERNKSTLDEIVLYVTDQDFIKYGQALIDFWTLLPEDMYYTKMSE